MDTYPLFFSLFRSDPRFVTIKEGEVLFRQGDQSNGEMYVLVAGQAGILVGDRVVEEVTSGAILGEMAIIEPNEPRSATVRAMTDCQFATVTPKRFHFLVTEVPHFAIDIMRVLTRRLRNADHMMAA